jgi:hypothetical protein
MTKTGWGHIWREPLLHFLLLGLLLFLLNALFEDSSLSEKQIVITEKTKAQLIANYELDEDQPPTEEELAELIDSWITDELLYREGLALGLDISDQSIRTKIVNNMYTIIRNSIVIDSPDDEELRRFFAENLSDYEQPELYNFSLANIGTEEEIDQQAAIKIAVELNRDSSKTEPSYPYHTAQLAQQLLNVRFGEPFTQTLHEQESGQWTAIESWCNWQIVRLNEIVQKKTATFEDVRSEVESEWKRQKQNQLTDQALKNLLTNYNVVTEEVQ